jgi:hypothetical protein
MGEWKKEKEEGKPQTNSLYIFTKANPSNIKKKKACHPKIKHSSQNQTETVKSKYIYRQPFTMPVK